MKILLTGSHGGHLSELKALSPAFEGHDLIWVSTRSVTTEGLDEILEPIGTNRLQLFKSLWAWRRIMRQYRPDVVISTGSEICLGAMLWARIYNIRSLYIECSARVTSASKTGRLVSFIADDVWVQWPQCVDAFGKKASYHGGTL